MSLSLWSRSQLQRRIIISGILILIPILHPSASMACHSLTWYVDRSECWFIFSGYITAASLHGLLPALLSIFFYNSTCSFMSISSLAWMVAPSPRLWAIIVIVLDALAASIFSGARARARALFYSWLVQYVRSPHVGLCGSLYYPHNKRKLPLSGRRIMHSLYF